MACAFGTFPFLHYFFPCFGVLGVLDHGAVFVVCLFSSSLSDTFYGLDILDIVHFSVMGLYIAAR